MSYLRKREYIFQAYVNHESEVIFLGGLPDIKKSRPQDFSSDALPEAIGQFNIDTPDKYCR